jgi:hypothetical protein
VVGRHTLHVLDLTRGSGRSPQYDVT